MLMKRNLLESLTIVSCGGTVLCVLLNYVTNISPITGVWFTIYLFLLFIVSVTFSIKFIQWLLHLNKPLKYDLEGLVHKYPQFGFLTQYLPDTRKKKSEEEECKEYDTNELSVISTVLERKLVSSWYLPYVSQDIGFPFACKQMLDQMIGRTFQICNKIETKEVYVDLCSVLITHLKEYRKANKRHEKCPKESIESLYKKSHPISTNSDKNNQPAEHCTNILRIILKELVPWELWDTPHSELLVRILSKKLDNFIDNTLAEPRWLNDKLMTILKGKSDPKPEPEAKIPDLIPEEFPRAEIVPEDIPIPEAISIESALSTVIAKSTAPILATAITEELGDTLDDVECAVEEAEAVSEPVELRTSPVLRQRRGRQGRNEVKIYDRIIEGSVKTWETDIDLQCISLGQDLLASLNNEITLSRLWGQDAEPGADPPLWFGEEDTLDMELQSQEPSPVKKEHSPKPAELLKDLQTTVSQAKTKIGDLQVQQCGVIHVPRNNDEAAGMMEGLLDFGIAGLKKGLRFTGLSDDSQDKSPSHREKGDKSSPPPEVKMKPAEPKEIYTSSIIQREDNGPFVPPLVKQQRVASQDSVSQSKPIPRVSPLPPAPDSPEPEYEEAADLSTSIAKLRCLLQQREPSPTRTEDIWWEGAEETRGRTQHHPSSRPVDSATLADEYDMNADRNTSPGQTTNNMQRLDKLFQRTVTGVFNSLKTAVGAEEAAASPRDWAYVCTSVELSVGGAVARLVGSRRAFNHVDAALDSLDQLAAPPQKKHAPPEDFEEWCSTCGRGWSACAELVCAALAPGAPHVASRAATLLMADLAESVIEVYLEELTAWLRKQVFVVFEQMSRQETSSQDRRMREMDMEETCAALLERIPAHFILGEDALTESVQFVVSSFSHKELNRDVVFRALDLFALHFKTSAGLRNPSFDSN